MKSLTRILPVMAAALMIFSLPVLADEGTMGQYGEKNTGTQKDECLLVAKDCGVSSINARVERIEREISKGSSVYTDQELNQLKRELNDAYRIKQIDDNHFPPTIL
jgi:hypothetical protein